MMIEFLLFIIIISVACFLQGILGFGFALLAVPLSLIFLEKETVVCSMLIVSFVLNGFLIKKIQASINGKLVVLLFLPSLIGMPIGIEVLNSISADLMKILVGGLSIIFTFILYLSSFRLPKSNLLTGLVGFLSGILQTSSSMSGPPVALLLAGYNFPKNKLRKTLAYFFYSTAAISIIFLFSNRLITFQRISFGLTSIPFIFLAGFLGDKIAAKVPQRIFKFLVLGAIFLLGFYSILSGLL